MSLVTDICVLRFEIKGKIIFNLFAVINFLRESYFPSTLNLGLENLEQDGSPSSFPTPVSIEVNSPLPFSVEGAFYLHLLI